MTRTISRVLIGMMAVTGVACFASVSAVAAEANWLVDFEKAKELAQKEGKDLLLDFTGSDWCTFCIQLDNNVFSKDVFAKKIPEKFVLVKLDSPNDKSHQSEAEQKMVKELAKKYSISGYPTILLTDATGRPYASLVGYDQTPAEKYVEDLLAKQRIREKRDELFKKAEAAAGIEKAKLLDQALSPLDPELTMKVYNDVVDQIISADQKNEAGLKKKYSQLRADIAFKSEVEAILNGLEGPQDVPAAAVKLEKLIEKAEVGNGALQEGLFWLAQLVFESDKAKSEKLLKKAIQLDPQSELASQMKSVLKRFFAKEAPKDQNEKE